MPAVVGQAQEAALATIKLSGIHEHVVVPVDDPSQTKGNVVSTEPAAGAVAPLDTTIVVKVASGKVKMPNLVGLDTSVAQIKVTDLKLAYDDSKRVESTTVLEGKVVAQDVPADTLVDVGTTIKVQIAVRPAVTITTTQTQTITAPPSTPPPTTTGSQPAATSPVGR